MKNRILREFSIPSLLLLAIVFGGTKAIALEQPVWGSDLTNALKAAQPAKRPVLVRFHAPWCPYCRQMESRVFPDAEVIQLLNQFERVAINIDANPSIAARHAIRGIPAFLILDSDANVAAKTNSFMEKDVFERWLKESLANLNELQAENAEFKTRSEELKGELESRDETARKKGLSLVLDWCERPEAAYRKFGIEQLQILASKQPGLILEGLNHPRLMARIRIANLLRQKLGESFDIDPWDKADARQSAVQAWKGRLQPQFQDQ